MSWLLLSIVLVYVLLIGLFSLAAYKLPYYKPKSQRAYNRFSIVIPFRNEAANLPRLLESLARLDYPIEQFTIFLINDDSQDNSLEIVKKFMSSHSKLSIQCLPNKRVSGSPKKDAISLAISHSQEDWIVTTDADCTVPASWLHTLNSFILDKQPKMIAGPVAIATTSNSFLNGYEQLDILSLMGATMGGFGMRMPFLCNGAHLAYEKKAFQELGGFVGNDDLATGDDHFLLEKFYEAFPSQVQYLKTQEAIIPTQPQSQWSNLISQRVRWASKTKRYSFWFSKTVGSLVFLANLAMVVGILMLGFLAFAKALISPLLLIALLLKMVVDFILISQTSHFFSKKKTLKYYPIVMLCYPFITLYIALASLFSSYEWKGRRFTK